MLHPFRGGEHFDPLQLEFKASQRKAKPATPFVCLHVSMGQSFPFNTHQLLCPFIMTLIKSPIAEKWKGNSNARSLTISSYYRDNEIYVQTNFSPGFYR